MRSHSHVDFLFTDVVLYVLNAYFNFVPRSTRKNILFLGYVFNDIYI